MACAALALPSGAPVVEVAAVVVLLAGLLLLDGLVGEVNDSGRAVEDEAVVAAEVVELLTGTVVSSWADISGAQVKVKVANASSKVTHCIVIIETSSDSNRQKTKSRLSYNNRITSSVIQSSQNALEL